MYMNLCASLVVLSQVFIFFMISLWFICDGVTMVLIYLAGRRKYG